MIGGFIYKNYKKILNNYIISYYNTKAVAALAESADAYV